MTLVTDEALIARVAAGDAAALDCLFRRHHERVFALCVQLSGDRTVADDLVQDTFLRVMRHAGSFKARARFTTWLYRIAHNLWLDEWSKRARQARLVVEPVSAAEESDPRVELVGRALRELSEPVRAALVFSRWHGLTSRELATVLGCSESAARVRVHRAVKEIAVIIRRMAADAEHV